MGASLQNRGGGRRGRRHSHPMADINITPFVDVMLVLLIIFMVTAPLLVAGVPVDLPDARAKPLPAEREPVQVSLDQAGLIYVNREQVAADDLPATLQTLAQGLEEPPRVYVRADSGLDYGRVMAVVDAITQSGLGKIALVTEPGATGVARPSAP